MIARVCLIGVAAGWFALCTLAEARRLGRLPEDPALRAGLEAELAGRYCAGVRVDPERFRAFAHGHGLGHADLYARPRASGLEADLAALTRALRAAPGEPCDRLWADYGDVARRTPLLRRT